jgi:hypothetical protein
VLRAAVTQHASQSAQVMVTAPPSPERGGGWVIGKLESHDRLCRSLARQPLCHQVRAEGA